MREPAVHWPPATDTRSLSATGMPSSGRSASSAWSGSVPRGGQAGVGGVGLGEGPFAVDREPRVEATVVALRRREVRLGQLMRRDVAGPQEGGHLVGEEPGRIGHPAQRSSRMAGTTMKSPSRAGALARTASTGQRRSDDVLAKDVLELDRLCRRGDVVGRQLGQDGVLVEDVVELALEPRQLGIGEPEAGEMGDVLDVRSRQGGHAPDDTGDAAAGRGIVRPRRR